MGKSTISIVIFHSSVKLPEGNPSCKWIKPTYPTYNHVYNLLTKWGQPGNPGKTYQERRRVWLLWTERCWCGGTDEARMQFCAS